MAESIEYSSIVKFITDDIIQEKLAHLSRQSGGMNDSILGESRQYDIDTTSTVPVSSVVPSRRQNTDAANTSAQNTAAQNTDAANTAAANTAAQNTAVPNTALNTKKDSEDALTTKQNTIEVIEDITKVKGSEGTNILTSLALKNGQKTITDYLNSTFPALLSYPIATSILAFSLTSASIYYFANSAESEDRNSNLLYILGAGIVGFLLAGPIQDMEITQTIQNVLFGEASIENVNNKGAVIGELKNRVTASRLYANTANTANATTVAKGGFMTNAANAANAVIDFVKTHLKEIIIGAIGVTVIAGFFAVDRNLSFAENWSNLWGGRSSKGVSFYFDESKGNIGINGKLNRSNIQLNFSKHFGVEGITMDIAGDKITYKVNKVPLESYSYIEGRPIHTALVMAYLVKDKHYNRFAPRSSASKSDSKYLYSIEDDGTVRLFEDKGNGVRGDEQPSMTVAIKRQLEGNNAAADKAKTEVCKTLFGVDIKNSTCANHFYNILGKSALGMLQNMGDAAIKKDTVAEALVSAQPHIKYEILKNLDWKMKLSNGKKEMVNVDQWLERLEQDSRSGIKALATEYRTYLNSKPKVKEILNNMVRDINNNTRLLDEKYKEAVETPQPSVRTRKPRLSAMQVANLRSQVLTENVALNTPFPMPGVPGAMLYNYTNPFQMMGGSSNNAYTHKFNSIKQSLAGFNQKLSSETDRKINSKISEIGSLNDKLEDISRKITDYTKILRSEKYPTGISRTVTLSDVENLINQYKSGTQEQTKQIVTLSTAFGKIKMLLEKQDANAKPTEKSFMFDL